MIHPNVVVLAGPNGAGKSTLAEPLLAETLGIRHFVNADTLARGLSAFHAEDMAIKAGKIMLEHLHDLAERRVNFAFETTLASRTFAPWIAGLKASGYQFHLFYVWVPSAEVSVQRVLGRVMMGGHGVPEETIRRRYQRGEFLSHLPADSRRLGVLRQRKTHGAQVDCHCRWYNGTRCGRKLVDEDQGTGAGMKEEQEINVREILKDRTRLEKALRNGVQKALRLHKAMGVPIIVGENGKIIVIPPEEIELLDETNGRANKSNGTI